MAQPQSLWLGRTDSRDFLYHSNRSAALRNNVLLAKASDCGSSEHHKVLPNTSHCALLPAYIWAMAHVATWLPPTFPDRRDHFQVVGCIQGLEEVQDIFRTWIEELMKEESLQWTVTVLALHCKALKLTVRNTHRRAHLFVPFQHDIYLFHHTQQRKESWPTGGKMALIR